MKNTIDAINVGKTINTVTEPVNDGLIEIYSSVRDIDYNEAFQDSLNHLEAISQRLDYLIALIGN